MNISSGRVLDRLAAEEECLGALFTSYSFDPEFFENHVLRAILRLDSDPVEQAQRYHQEARQALQKTPVVAIVDASERQPGRRLPFDLLEVSSNVFHPKTVLLLYPLFARLQVGSGNLTFSGYGGNTELFFCMDLRYEDSADAALLAAFNEHIGRIRPLARTQGHQLDSFQSKLGERLASFASGGREEGGASDVALLDSTTGPILEQFEALLPDDAVIETIGFLAPFYERDDTSELDESSVFGALMPRMGEGAVVDVGVTWDNPSVEPPDDATNAALEDGMNCLWTWKSGHEREWFLKHLVPTGVGARQLKYLDEAGDPRRISLGEVRKAIEAHALWRQPPLAVFAPRKTLAAVGERFGEVRLWLHPAIRLIDDAPVPRPLHAKLLMVGYRAGGSENTLVLMGSPNMSRTALLRAADAGGNVEVALAFRLNASLTLRDFVPELVRAPDDSCELRERDFPEAGPNHGLAIDAATHDPEAGTLHVSWSDKARDLPAWRLTYAGKLLASSDAPPEDAVQVSNFVLSPESAEVVLHVGDGEYPAPILVTDLVALPAVPGGAPPGLGELLMLLGGRIGAERAVQIIESRAGSSPGASGVDEDNGRMIAFLDEGFGPTDVFRAWWSVAEDLKTPALSVQAFRLRLEGALGVGAAWKCMMEAGEKKADETGALPKEEVWFYGAELLRTLGEIDFSSASDPDAKNRVLASFQKRVWKDLDKLGFRADKRPWVKRIMAFYEEARS